ncbi:MAG: hypothetical protein J1F27_05660, partial [Prevotellaceae bacterium]|nr:hypothetical protein [Prevotellaceae bacterium]
PSATHSRLYRGTAEKGNGVDHFGKEVSHKDVLIAKLPLTLAVPVVAFCLQETYPASMLLFC